MSREEREAREIAEILSVAWALSMLTYREEEAGFVNEDGQSREELIRDSLNFAVFYFARSEGDTAQMKKCVEVSGTLRAAERVAGSLGFMRAVLAGAMARGFKMPVVYH